MEYKGLIKILACLLLVSGAGVVARFFLNQFRKEVEEKKKTIENNIGSGGGW